MVHLFPWGNGSSRKTGGQAPRMEKDTQGYPKVFLQTGDCYLAVQPTLVNTVLGSCLAVTMHSPRHGIGAICHAFLPDSSDNKRPGVSTIQPCRFVDTALETMLDSMKKLKIPKSDLVVKMFGGASGIAVRGMEYSSYDIGRRNVEMARKLLKFAGLDISVTDVGGNQGRKLLFLSNTGEVWLKRLTKNSFDKESMLTGRR